MIGKERESVRATPEEEDAEDNIEIQDEKNEKGKENEKENLIEIDEEEQIRFKEGNISCLKKYLFPSLKADVAYIMSIIDYFQIYNLQKNLETLRELKKKNLTKLEREKIESLYNLYLKQKNILIENETKKQTDQLISEKIVQNI